MRATVALMATLTMGCVSTPPDDPDLWDVDTSVEYEIDFDPVHWLIPSDDLPVESVPMASNNNVDIEFFKGRLYLSWRTAPTHFASAEALILVISSADGGKTWRHEARLALGSDKREPRFFIVDGVLKLMFFQGGTNPLAFEPQRIWVSELQRTVWSSPEVYIDAPVVPWDIKTRQGALWMTSYAGEHYSGNASPEIELFFERSTDGVSWAGETVYFGGVSEAAFEFDASGNLWAVTRNEDGDHTGFGSHVCFAEADALMRWSCSDRSDPERYDSPEMFRHGDDLYMVARRDIGGPFGPEGNLYAYSTRPKTTALYQINQDERVVEHVMDLPGAGDTAFPAVRRVDAHTFVMVNYTSPLDDPDITWLEGQTSERGTQIYLTHLRFSPKP